MVVHFFTPVDFKQPELQQKTCKQLPQLIKNNSDIIMISFYDIFDQIDVLINLSYSGAAVLS